MAAYSWGRLALMVEHRCMEVSSWRLEDMVNESSDDGVGGWSEGVWGPLFFCEDNGGKVVVKEVSWLPDGV